ncbi:MAG: hypothetical protein DRP42_05040, partial [Tenericutes bacterium]
AALGVEPSYISQLLSNEEFAAQVATLRYEALSKHNERDGAYDTLEDKLLAKLEKSLSLIFKPDTLLKAIQVVNGAKRRGQSAPEQVTNQNTVVSLLMPVQIVNKFTTNINNQVVKAGDQDLITIPSGQLLKQTEQLLEERVESANPVLESLGG